MTVACHFYFSLLNDFLTSKTGGVRGRGRGRVGMDIRLRVETPCPGTDLLHESFQLVSILPEAALHPAEHLGVELAVAGQSQVVF